jgi:hypothetical protein
VNSGAEQGLVDVNVAEAANQRLIEKNRLDLPWAASQALFKPCGRETSFERLATQPSIQTIEIIAMSVDDPAELALVGEAQVEAVVELDRQSLEAERRFLSRNRAESPGHP